MATLAWIALAIFLIHRLSNKKPRYNPENYLNPAPDAQPKYVVFDVETTGLPPDRFPTSPEDIERWQFPYIVSMAWLVLSEDFQLIKSEHHLIKPPVAIPDNVIAIHGITNERVKAEGVALKPVLEAFAADVAAAGNYAAHNLHFDKTLVAAERIRHALPDPFAGHKGLDTMKLGADWMGRKSFKLRDAADQILPHATRRRLPAHDALADTTVAAHLLIYSLAHRARSGYRPFVPSLERPQVTLENTDTGLRMVEIGEEVKFWLPSDRSRANFYAYGTYGGDGKVGEMPSSAVDWAAEQLDAGSELTFTVAEKARHHCVLDIHIKTANEIQAEKDAQHRSTLEKLHKPYRPRKPLTLSLYLDSTPPGLKLRKGTPLELILPNEQSFHPDSPIPTTVFRLNGQTLESYRDATTAIKLLRARNSGFTLSAILTTLGRKRSDGSRDIEIEIQYEKPDTI